MDDFFPQDKVDCLEGEEWKPIKDYDNKYYISNYGRIISLKKKEPYLIKCHYNNKGYPRAELYKNGKRKRYFVHRLVAMEFVPNDDPLNKTTVDHIDMNR